MSLWRPVVVFMFVSAGATTAIAFLTASRGWTVHSPAWALLAPLAMWAPALGRFLACRTVDRNFTSTLSLSRWGETGARVVVLPLVVPLVVYGIAYFVAWMAGMAHWSPGGGRWTTGTQIALNLVVNLTLLGVFGTATALGEELGWRGYLQPRLDAAGIRFSVIIVWLCQLAYHAPLAAGAGYVSGGGLLGGLFRFAAADLVITYLWAAESYRARSLWPAVFFHSFHNTISQWLFPRFFAGGENERWLGEGGFLPAGAYVVVGLIYWAWMRQRGPSWRELTARSAKELPDPPAERKRALTRFDVR